MGVHDLWSIIEPVRESVPLYSLSGKTLAVDLSLWVCEAQHVQAMMGRVTKPHLRNLFFRVSSLVLMGVKLVFVMEGEAPKLKAETMSQRTANRFGGPPKVSKSSTNTSRGRFNAVLRECAEMLDCLGVPWVVAAGEAEAMCAHLDSHSLVDGCITNDGDVFLYGARTVYRNFNMNSKDPQVDCYKTSRVQTELRLSRENLVGLAILLGCDYIPKGIPSVGKEQALKLIQTIKGQTLLQRFMRWKDEAACVSQGVVKKLPHCHICRHPGSAKAHERSGCVLCDSQRFCQPQDFDYQCPCDWHRSERTRQARSIEANIKKKTLASQQFPFTEIINEFLLCKEKPVGNFKSRQPNMLSMQKFALDKMEWPKHYTSEKVLVLMTYTELMNRKCGRIMSSQIKPIRISKQRVRNSVSCFEVIWSTPDHYVFPEDQPAKDQHEVRSVEEASLFRVAFPEVVESYLNEKALAEEKKTKKRNPKSKKEKTPDEADEVLDLLAQMTLQSSPPEKAKTQRLPSVLPNMQEVVLLDTPVSHKHQGLTEICPGTPLSQADSSPSVSAAIDTLHLSDIDWDALSFTATPPPQTVPKAPPQSTAEPIGDDVKDVVEAELKTSTTQHSDAGPEHCFTECPLRDRLLMRNTSTATEAHNNKVPKQLSYLVPILKPIADTRKESDCIKISGEATPAVQSQTKTDKRPPHKYKFVRAAAAKLQRCHSEPCQADKDRKATVKKTVCMSVCSSSEDSDAENQQIRARGTTKSKHTYKPKGRIPSDLPPKLVCGPLKTTSENVQSLMPKCVENGDNVTNLQSKTKVETHVDVVVLPTPASPSIVLDSDDSVVCGDSPLPLAERLKLKFFK
ncbi:flap endonuclease GEN homolog 1-like isoform X1 [Phyllopteryx taeniolatus]|uniref:flap endonuclease GEN homolog 1-like isoform X1 n=1 Tax=Phyllopteryx taeniolatus TaxID=161469 RepID=UPI002AD2427A|nr:flap endonuclease GEN homolog 1-like isoform X1 [Phyllopteryx taeniolatus]